MGLDGLSVGNLGLHKDLTSAQMANQAEQAANKNIGFKIKDIDQVASEKGIQSKEEGSKNSPESFFEENFNEEEQNEFGTNKQKVDEKIFEKTDPKEFSVRVNQKTEMVELFNNKDNKIIETISATDLMQLISKLDSASGILVNRKI